MMSSSIVSAPRHLARLLRHAARGGDGAAEVQSQQAWHTGRSSSASATTAPPCCAPRTRATANTPTSSAAPTWSATRSTSASAVTAAPSSTTPSPPTSTRRRWCKSRRKERLQPTMSKKQKITTTDLSPAEAAERQRRSIALDKPLQDYEIAAREKDKAEALAPARTAHRRRAGRGPAPHAGRSHLEGRRRRRQARGPRCRRA